MDTDTNSVKVPLPVVPTPTPSDFRSKEYWLILYLIAAGYKIINVECHQDDKGQDFLIWTFPQEATEDERRYNHRESMMVDLHKMEDAAKVFKRNLQFFRIR